MNIEIIHTADGSHSLFNQKLNETYHSVHGAIQESRHVFIKNGLDYVFQKNKPESISIFEVGLGTGLNALLILEYAIGNQVKITYSSIEAFPIEPALASELNYPNQVDSANASDYFKKIHTSVWNQTNALHTCFNLVKIDQPIQSYQLAQATYDVVFFDAFAPEKQPDMWTIDVLKKATGALKPSGVFVTYCAKGQLRRDLVSLDLKVEKLPGPPGKREMIRAVKV